MMQVGLEASRLLALEQYAVLDTPSEPSFDRIAQLTALVLDAPIAVIGFLDGSRHWFKAAFGTDQRQNHRAQSFCTHTIEQAGIFEVADARLDSRFNELQVLRDAGIRSYAGAPLATVDGERIGTLCIFDTRVRLPLEPTEKALLLELASLTMQRLEARISDPSTADSRIPDLQGLDWHGLYGRGDDAPMPPTVSGTGSSGIVLSGIVLSGIGQGGNSLSGADQRESKLLERVRSVAPAPMIARAARLPRGRALLTHALGAAQTGRVWQVWGLGKTGAPKALESFAGEIAAFDLPADAALLLLSLEELGNAPNAPTRVLASGQMG